MKYERIFCFGDSITLGCNDSRGLGWPGRLCRGLTCGEYSVAAYNLGVNGDTSAQIAARWRAEAGARSRNSPGLLVFAFGFNDAAHADGRGPQLALEESVATARALLTSAKAVSEVLWIGPTPLDESVNPMQTSVACWEMHNAEIARYDAAYAELGAELGLPYLRLFPEFVDSPRYHAALAAGDRVHPGDDGYAMIAERIGAWEGWVAMLRETG
ncbi:MAG: GDSL-type esterase/lipase family protein [Gammaproteobacteria bacterium]|jgi:lysophospholipase L1-like esterase